MSLEYQIFFIIENSFIVTFLLPPNSFNFKHIFKIFSHNKYYSNIIISHIFWFYNIILSLILKKRPLTPLIFLIISHFLPYPLSILYIKYIKFSSMYQSKPVPIFCVISLILFYTTYGYWYNRFLAYDLSPPFSF